MRLDELAQKIGAKMINNNKLADVEITRYYAGDKISELLTKACAGTLVVGNIVNPHIFRVAELLDVPAICLLNNFVPEQEMINAANEHCTILMVSPVDKSETLSRLTECLGKKARIDL